MDRHMIKIDLLSEEFIQQTPLPVLELIVSLCARVESLEAEVERLRALLNKNSSNSNQPPSSDPPFQKKAKEKGHGKPGAKKGHPGHRQALLTPTEERDVRPGPCSCGNSHFPDLEKYYTHQVLELPEIRMDVLHVHLYRGKCPHCGKINKAVLPQEHRTGYGPRFSAMIAEMAGAQADSRRIVQNFCASVLGVHISLGAIQKIIDRVSAAIRPHYEEIGARARRSAVNHVDETSWRENGKLNWLWVLGNAVCAYFMIHSKRSRTAFEELIQDWEGILIADGYAVYQHWVGQRQACLAHLIREAKGLSERGDPEISRFGVNVSAELRRLCHMATAPPTVGQWRAFYARLIKLIVTNRDRSDGAGKFARRLEKEMEHLWCFLQQEGVAPTNNHAERLLRFAVLWRKGSFGTASDKGNRWVERILSVRQTCRLQGKRTFPILVEAMRAWFHDQGPDLTWIGRTNGIATL